MRIAARLEICAKALKIRWDIDFNPEVYKVSCNAFGRFDLYKRLIVPIDNGVPKGSG